MWIFSGKKQKTPPKPADLSAPDTPSRRRLSYQVASLQGIGRRERQEDDFLIINGDDVVEMGAKGLLAAVADGMGGMKDGSLASRTAIECLQSGFDGLDRSTDLADQLSDIVFRAGGQIRALLGGDGGSTVVVCLIFGEKLYFVSVGDSYLYLKRGTQLYRLNREHTYRSLLYLQQIRSGKMDPKAAEEDKESGALVQFLGMSGMDEIDGFKHPYPLKDGDVLLLCSDGVGGVLSEEQILGCLSWPKPTEICANLEENVLKQGLSYQDNYTAVVVRCGY